MSIIAGNLKMARGKMTQMRVARALGISQAVLSKVESGKREPTAAELKRFSELYKRPIEYFFREPEANIADLLRTFFEKMAKKCGISLAFLYGSFARGLPNERSDIDIALLFSNSDITDETAFDIVSNISAQLSKQFKREVNIIVIDPENWKPMLYYNSIVLGELLYAKEREKYYSVRSKALCLMEDFASLGLAWQIAAAQANLRRIKNG